MDTESTLWIVRPLSKSVDAPTFAWAIAAGRTAMDSARAIAALRKKAGASAAAAYEACPLRSDMGEIVVTTARVVELFDLAKRVEVRL